MRGPTYRGLRLNGPLAEFHRAIDRLRWDTDPRGTEAQPSMPAPARPGHSEPNPPADRPPLFTLPA